jgi:rhamnosyltransferase
MKTALIIPTLNAKPHLEKLLPALKALSPQPDKVLVIDSSSTDGTPDLFKAAGFNVHVIPKSEFGHGKTRNLGARMCEGHDVLIYLTQDAIPAATDLVAKMVKAFENPKVAVATGRQLPHDDANTAAAFARLHNYPAQSHVNTAADIPAKGLKALFCSNSFAAYRAEALAKVGGFPEHLPMGEDLAVAGRFLEAGYASAYVADACVHHSHNYSVEEEFRRYFDIGALLRVDPWLRERPMKTGGEGVRYVMNEFRYTKAHGSFADLLSIVPRSAAKYGGFHLGMIHEKLPRQMVRQFSMHRYFWS